MPGGKRVERAVKLAQGQLDRREKGPLEINLTGHLQHYIVQQKPDGEYIVVLASNADALLPTVNPAPAVPTRAPSAAPPPQPSAVAVSVPTAVGPKPPEEPPPSSVRPQPSTQSPYSSPDYGRAVRPRVVPPPPQPSSSSRSESTGPYPLNPQASVFQPPTASAFEPLPEDRPIVAIGSIAARTSEIQTVPDPQAFVPLQHSLELHQKRPTN